MLSVAEWDADPLCSEAKTGFGYPLISLQGIEMK